jgi:tRNA-2-methylthio-N6-dimethylallyladenosine synthase
MKSIYYESYGCQMNAYDTEAISSMLALDGFITVDTPEEADVILVNTCSVRENAEQRAIGRLNDLSRHSGSILAVCGCMAQRMGESLFDSVPGLDVVAGTDTYHELAGSILHAMEGMGRTANTRLDGTVTYSLEEGGFRSGVTRYLSITRGCENFCSYCIVPYVRGSVRSKDPDTILREVRGLISAGAKEITLLGQNVMSYSCANLDFYRLSRLILEETGIKRLRFLTTHPRDLDMRVMQIMADSGRLCPHLHLPVQSGSDRILGLMHRGYTSKQYLDKLREARKIVPDLAVTTDIIVGFPSETEGDFLETLSVVESCRFEAAFTFKYSPRQGTAAALLPDDVKADTKKARLQRLNERIQSIRLDLLESQLCTDWEILLDDKVKKGEYRFGKGRTPHFRNVLVPETEREPGEFFKVRLEKLRNFTFIGREI